MKKEVLDKIYANDLYLTYLRYHPNWYLILNQNPGSYSMFEKEIKTSLKITAADKIDKFRKQLNFINGMIKYLSNN